MDHSFGNDGWFHLFPRVKTEYMHLWAFDHRPIRTSFALESDGTINGRFYFDKRMVKKEGFEEVVRKGRCDSEKGEL